MRIIETDISGPLLIEPDVFTDARGFFMESWNAAAFRRHGLDLTFVQDNHAGSKAGTIRGLHFQNPNPQGKLVRVIRGSVWDVAVDLRRSSPSFGKWIGTELSAANRKMKWVPPGFAHGYFSQTDSEVLYRCTASYDPASERSLRWDDPALGIAWPLAGATPLLSAKDLAGMAFADIEAFP